MGKARLIDIRYADDLLLFAKTFDEVVHMFETLSEELGKVGLIINATKTKIVTTTATATESDAPLFADAGVCMEEVLRCDATHKHPGRLFSGDLR